MSWVTGIAVYVVVWWIVLFTVLPWGAQAPDEPGIGHAPSAPARPRMLLKVAVTSGISAIVWGIIYWLVVTDLISFRDMAKGM